MLQTAFGYLGRVWFLADEHFNPMESLKKQWPILMQIYVNNPYMILIWSYNATADYQNQAVFYMEHPKNSEDFLPLFSIMGI